MIPRKADLVNAKQEMSSSNNGDDDKRSKATTTASWSRLKDPRIVRVSRAVGGKDRHSKVCTVRGLRDRRVRLSVPTAIQLYDLQERLGLNQPSKVVDWLLNVAKNEIDQLPPLQFPIPDQDTSADNQSWSRNMMMTSTSTSTTTTTSTNTSHQDHVMTTNYTSFGRWDPSSSLSHGVAATAHQDMQSFYQQPGMMIAHPYFTPHGSDSSLVVRPMFNFNITTAEDLLSSQTNSVDDAQNKLRIS